MDTDESVTPSTAPGLTGDSLQLEPVLAEPALDAAERVSYLGFYLGAEVFGLPLDVLREVCRLTRVRRVPGAPSRVAGMVNLRGEIVCALDTRAILGVTSPAPAGPAYFVALRGFPDPLGLVVDGITDIYAVDPDAIEAPPQEWPAERSRFFAGTASTHEGTIGLLNVRQIVGES
jgi:purine-binding chemotaxis protein CheW